MNLIFERGDRGILLGEPQKGALRFRKNEKGKSMRALKMAAVLLPLAACGASPLEDPDQWSCDALIEPVIELSQDRALSILEITSAAETQRTYGPKPTIKCRASAEWSYGDGYIVYEAYVSNGGQIILGYERK